MKNEQMQHSLPDKTDSGNQMKLHAIEEHVSVEKQVVETGKVQVKTIVSTQEATVNIPILSERYEVKRVPVNEVYTTAPPVRSEGDRLIVPVIEEVIVVEKRYKVVEEVHLIKHVTETPHLQEVPLQKQEVVVQRTSSDGTTTQL